MTGEIEILVTRADRVRVVMHALGFTNRCLLVGGTYIGSLQYFDPQHVDTQPVISTYDPTTDEELARLESTDFRDYGTVVEAAKTAFDNWRQWPAPARARVVGRIGDAFAARKELLARLISIEMGKILPESLGEVEEAVQACRELGLGLGWRIGGEGLKSERRKVRPNEDWDPLGVVGVITPANFPLAVWAWNFANAAVCGDTIVWKGSELTPLVSIAVQKICSEVFEHCDAPNVCNLVTGGAELGRMMAYDENLLGISFTGSCKAGREVAQIVSGHLGRRVLLELGGNNAGIVAEDADLDLAVSEIIRSAFGTTGQRCTTMRRLMVHESVADEICRRLATAREKLIFGDPLGEGIFMGPLMTSDARNKMLYAHGTALGQGGMDVLRDGKYIGNPLFGLGLNFVWPYIIRMPSQTPIVLQETFAPILYVMTYKNLDEAIAMNNAVEQGLASSIFTTDLRKAEHFLASVDTGLRYVNMGTSGAEVGWAFGGNKATGDGREAGSDSWKWYMRRKTCATFYGTLAELELAQGIKRN